MQADKYEQIIRIVTISRETMSKYGPLCFGRLAPSHHTGGNRPSCPHQIGATPGHFGQPGWPIVQITPLLLTLAHEYLGTFTPSFIMWLTKPSPYPPPCTHRHCTHRHCTDAPDHRHCSDRHCTHRHCTHRWHSFHPNHLHHLKSSTAKRPKPPAADVKCRLPRTSSEFRRAFIPTSSAKSSIFRTMQSASSKRRCLSPPSR